MAEFALGLTKTALEGTVSRVKSAIDEEAKLNVRVQNDLVFITGEFEMMQSFLNAANKERVSNQVVRTWVRQIRDLAFDVEDCLEFVVHLDTNKPWAWLWRVVPSCMAPPQPIDEAVAEIQRLKARVEDVSHRNARYNLIGDSGTISKTTALVTTVSKLPAPELMHDPDASSSAFHILRDVWEAAGKMRRDMGDLKKVINKEGSVLEVISLLGGPGSAADLGVTHIIREAYNDPKICKEFKSRAWVKLMHPFNPDEFLKSLLTQFYASSHRAKVLDAEFRRKMREAVDKEDDLMKAQLMQQVSDEQRYLVIVEQLSSVSEWDTIRMYLRDSTNGSRIVVTTQQLGLALSCTGNPYQVSELRQFSYGQSLYAFFSKVSGRRSDMAELIWQLRDGGVISVWGRTRDETTLVYEVYTGITQKSKEFEGVEFKRHSWVDVPDPFDLGVFSRHLFFNFHSEDLRAAEIKAAGMMGDTGLIEGCCKFLCEDDCLVVINGLNSTDDWDQIKAAFFSEPSRGCIIVITEEESVARHCADKVDRVLNVRDLDADVLLRHSIKGCEYYGIGGKEASRRGRFFSNDRMKEARDWMDKFGLLVDPMGLYSETISDYLGVICLSEIDSAEKSALARKFYYEQMLHSHPGDLKFTEFSWVDVPDPFDLTDFCWRLLLDFYSDDLEAKQTTAVGMMEGCQNPIQGCLELLRQHKCFVVIDGLRSGDDWDQIKQALSFETSGLIMVIAKEKSVHLGGVKFIDAPDYYYHAGQPLIKTPGYSNQDVSRAFSSRIIKAFDWIKNFELCKHHQSEWYQLWELRQGSVTSVWGIAGIGKSYLIRRFYYTSMTGGYDFSCFSNLQRSDTEYSWVDVPHPFDLTDLSRRLLLDFHSDDLEAKETAAVGMMEGQDPIQVCREFLHQHKCLVVIDGLRSKDDWDLIKSAFLSEPINKCYIIVITKEESIAKHCVDKEEDVVNVKGLNVDEALNLFKIANFGSKELTSNEEELSITTKCGGIPEVLAAIGKYCQEWKYCLETINADFMGTLETDPAFHSLRGLFDWMRSYFDACPDSLKPCIFYLSVFPLGHGIRRRRLLRRWIAEGYSMDTPSSTAEENGEEFFSKLVKLSIIQEQQQQSPSKAKKCQVNGFFREYIISRPMQDNLVFALEGRCIPNSQRAGQHLTISTSWDRDKILLESLELSRLRSLTVFGGWRSFFMSTDVKMRLLRVLDLEDTLGVTDGDMEQIGELLPRLKFLSLRGCKDITRLPSSLGGLRQLQTLDIKGTSIVTLPPAIMKLEKLQYVRAGITRCISTSPEDDNGPVAGITRPPAAADGDGASTSQSPATALTTSTTAPVDGDGESRSQPLAASAAATTTPVDGDGESTSQPLAASAAADDEARTSTPCRPRGGLVFSWLSKLHRHGLVSGAQDGVQFPVVAAGGIGRLTALHTLGVVNVGGASGKAVLRELKKLTQLRKLKLSGINHKNWVDFCSVISGHGYLESLSVRLDEDPKSASPVFACFSDISEPPKTLKTLKVYGRKNAQISPVWIKQLRNLTKSDLGLLTVSTQEDIDALPDLPRDSTFGSFCVKPIQDGELRFDWGDWSVSISMEVLEIYCSSYKSEIVFRPSVGQFLSIDVLVVHCSSSTEASLELSGLDTISWLGKVLLKGSYSDALEQDLRQQVGRLPGVRFETDPSSS